jgi:hypothetical protein
VLIFKDYKFKVEIFCVLQVIFLVFIANAQYCLYGVPYLAFGVIHLLTIALSHAKSDQTIRVVASVLNVLLLLFLPMDLGLHYSVHYIQESQRIDAQIDDKYYGQPNRYQLEGYQGIMATTGSYVTFGLKMGLLVIACMQYKYSYDMANEFDSLKKRYMQADSQEYPASFKVQDRVGLNADQARMQKYNKLLKLSYVRTFRKSWSFVVKLLQPISLFFLSVFQLIFCLEHESVLFLILLCCVMSGFFVELKDAAGQNAYALLCKIILCIECLYVLV